MKKLSYFLIITFLSLSYLNLNADEIPPEILSNISPESQKLYEQQKELENQANQINQGESLFFQKNKDSKNPANDYIQDNFNNNINNHPQLSNKNYSQYEGQIDENQLALMKSAIRNQNLNALQKTFFNKKYEGYENTKNIDFKENKTEKIRTRFAMATTLIFETDIQGYILGDSTGFKIEQVPNISNAIAIKPLLIGIDTSLTIFTKDNKLHTFYLFSTDYKNSKNPDLVVYIKDEESQKVKEEKQEELNKDYLIIKEGIAEMKVKKSDIYTHYKQKAKKENAWLLADEIFDDKKFTYFKYDKKKMPQIPSVFVVIDKQDSPIETRVIGDYIIAETTAQKFTIILGDTYVCVEKVNLEEEKKKEERKKKNIIDPYGNNLIPERKKLL